MKATKSKYREVENVPGIITSLADVTILVSYKKGGREFLEAVQGAYEKYVEIGYKGVLKVNMSYQEADVVSERAVEE